MDDIGNSQSHFLLLCVRNFLNKNTWIFPTLWLYTKAGQYLDILVIPWYWNQTICASSKFQRNNIIAFSIITVLLCLETFLRPED